jgi:hypothetical protein
MHPCSLHGMQCLDGAGQLAFQRTLEIHLFGELAGAEAGVIKQGEPGFAVARQTLLGELQPDFMHPVGGYEYGLAVARQPVRDILLAQRGHDIAPVPVFEVGEQHFIFRAAQP